MHGLLPGFLQTINNAVKEPTRVFVVIGLLVLSALFSAQASATEYGEYEEFGLGAFRERLFSQMESYDPYSGKVNFVHHDASIRSSSSLSVNFNRRFLNKLDTYGAHAGDWALSFGMVQNVSGFPSGDFCDQVLSRPFITPSGMIKEFVASLDIMRPNSPAIYQLVSTDGWRAYCWYAGNVPASYQYQEGNNPRGRDEVVFQSPDGTKYIVGQKFSRTTYPGSGGSSYGGNTEWLVTRVESAAGDWYNISYVTEKILLRSRSGPDDKVLTYKLSSIGMSDGSVINFDYETVTLKRTSDSNYQQMLLDKVRYNSAILVDYDYVKRTQSSVTPIESMVLSKANLGEGITWDYGNGMSASPYGDYVFTSPNGLTGTYKLSFTDFFDVSTAYLKSAQYTGVGINQTTHYDYETNTQKHRLSTTVKNGKTCIKYVHWGDHNTPTGADLYKRGTTKEVLTYNDNSCSVLAQKVIYTHAPIKVSNTDEVRKRPSATYHETRVPVVSNVKTEIYNNGGTDIFETTYSNWDGYLNPRTTVERFSSSGYATQTRTKTLTYENNVTAWVLGLPDTTTISGIAGSSNNDYHSNGLLKKSNSYGITNNYTYHTKGDLYQHTNPRNKVTTFSDYKKGVARVVSGPEGYSVTRIVDDYGNITSETKWGVTTGYGYDRLNRLTSVTTPSGSDFNIDIDYSKNSTGLKQTVTRGFHISESQYNGLGQLKWQKQTVAGVNSGTSASTTTYFNYDVAGNRTFVSYPNASTTGTTTAYDGLGRITTVTQSDNSKSTFTYKAGNKVSVTDAQGNTVTNTYLSWGNPGEKHLTKTEQPASSANTSAILSPAITTTIARNNMGLIDSVTQGGFTQDYAYTPSWQLDYINTPETGRTDYTFDANGNMTEKTVGGQKTIYTYDGLNRLDFVNYPAPAYDVDYKYNSKGQLEWVSKGNLKWSYAYTDNGVMNNETLTHSADAKTWAFAYAIDSYDNVASITYPNGNVISYNPDSAGRATKAGTLATNIKYHTTGALAGLTFGNGHVYTIGLDSLKRPKDLDVTNSVMDLTYAYYKDNNIQSITDHLNSANTISMQYDQHQRLRKVTGALWGSGEVSYDATGNILTKTVGGLDLSYSYNPTTNRLDTVSGGKAYAFGYDGAGNVTSNGSFTFTYDTDGAMFDAYNNATGDTYEYSYDAYNRRVKETKNSELLKYSVYSSAGQLLLEEDKDGYQTNFVYAAGQRIAALADCSATDTDGDSMLDCEEKQLGFDPVDPTDGDGDYDGDGLSNAYEFNNGLDMRNPDTDGDGMVDGWEVRNGLNPKVNDAYSDKDGDGLTNIQEYSLGTAANNADTDGDGIRDNVDDKPLFNLAAFIPVMMLILN